MEALAREAEHSFFKGGTPKTVYIGGGTPSILPLPALERVFTILRSTYGMTEVAEWSIEANPSTANRESFALLHSLGANRLSIGVQSFDDANLKMLSRTHNSKEAIDAFNCARELGFDNISLDLMFGLPEQTLENLRADLAQIVALEPEHISIYGLTPEHGTRLFAAIELGDVELADEELSRAMYLELIATLSEAGYAQYEISNFAREGFESRHNMGYWQYHDYEGLGPSAASFCNNERRVNFNTLKEWAGSSAGATRQFEEVEALSPEKRAREAAMLMLRTRAGIDDIVFKERTGYSIFELAQNELPALIRDGWLLHAGNNLSLSENALPIADSVLAEII